MALADVLRARAAFQGRSAQVACGALGTVTVEALPIRELNLIARSADRNRAVFYAACRELQAAGEELRAAGQIYTPDSIMQFVSDAEASQAARTILELSSGRDAEASSKQSDVNTRSENTRSDDGTDAGWTNEENRRGFVQSSGEDFSEVRPDIVRAGSGSGGDTVSGMTKDRHGFVQGIDPSSGGFGQVSRETDAGNGERSIPVESDKKAQAVADFPGKASQNVVSGQDDAGTGAPVYGGEREDLHEIESEFVAAERRHLHETESEFPGALHETESENDGFAPAAMHEIESEIPDGMHESKSESGLKRARALHEITSESAEKPHETESELRAAQAGRLHETESEQPEILHEITSDRREALHETTSDLAEAVARRLLEGLRRANWVR